jgi:hypothetical protein
MLVILARAEAKRHGQAMGLAPTTLPPRSLNSGAVWTAGRRDEARSLTANHANKPGAVAANPNPAAFATAGAHPTTRLEGSLILA